MRDRLLHILNISVAPTFQQLLARTESCAAVGVDIPIGLSDNESRQADGAARRALSPLRASSVFPAPVRATLAAKSYEEACALSFAACGKKLSKQTYAILPKIREADQAMTPERQERIVEVHPEVSFCALNKMQPLAHSKKSPSGAQQREQLLAKVFEVDLACKAVREGVWLEDFFDACAAAWTARRLARGEAERLPPGPPVDKRGLRMEIVY